MGAEEVSFASIWIGSLHYVACLKQLKASLFHPTKPTARAALSGTDLAIVIVGILPQYAVAHAGTMASLWASGAPKHGIGSCECREWSVAPAVEVEVLRLGER